jgi:ATP-dependent Clp endopeptidase proteolytic subunit ClpP
MSKKINNDFVDEFMEHGVLPDRRIIYLGGNYNEDGDSTGTDFKMAEKAIKALTLLDTAAPSGDKLITIYMNNSGGDIYQGMAIYDAIRNCVNPVHIIVYAEACSMGAWILQAADKRIMAPSSVLMIHDGEESVPTNHPQIARRWVQQNIKYEKYLNNILLERIREKDPKFSEAKLKKLLRFDTILSPQEAVDIGLADAILGEEED